jgi:hypothetical protein
MEVENIKNSFLFWLPAGSSFRNLAISKNNFKIWQIRGFLGVCVDITWRYHHVLAYL